MPILSGARFSYAQDDLFWPVTQTSWTDTPNYSFHFAKPKGASAEDDFNDHFILDNCANITKDLAPTLVTLADGHNVNLGDHRAYYYRLFALWSVARKGSYYLVPWLTVAFENLNGSFAPVAARNGGPGDPVLVQLSVKPFSIYEDGISRGVKRAIKQAAATLPKPQLALSSSHPAISAVWAETSDHLIDEDKCLRRQNVLIRIQPSATRYPDRHFLDIRRGTVLVGRVCLLFLEAIQHQLVVFKVIRQSSTKLRLAMLDVSASVLAEDCWHHVRDVFARCGIDYSPATPTMTLQLASGPVTCDLAHPVDIGPYSSDIDFADGPRITERLSLSIHRRFVIRVLPADRAGYVFVFLADWANEARPGGSSVGGNSLTGEHYACVFVETRENTSHEVGHALALPHYFYEALREGTFASKGGEAATVMGVTTRAQFYNLHDEQNDGNACTVFDQRAPQPWTAPQSAAQRYFHSFNLDRFPKFATSNLMDYRIGSGGLPKEDLVKNQIDALRYAVMSARVGFDEP